MPVAASTAAVAALGSQTRPAVPSGVAEYFLPNNLSFTEAFEAAGRPYPQEAHSQGLIYRPALLAQASIRFLNRTYELDFESHRTALATNPDRRGRVRWEEIQVEAIDAGELNRQPDPLARFIALEAPLTEAKTMSELEKDFIAWVYQTAKVTVRTNETLKVFAGPDISQADFRRKCSEVAQDGREKELAQVTANYEKKVDTLAEKLAREERELATDQSELSGRKMEEYTTHAETLLGLFGRRRKSISKSLTKRRLAEQAEADVKESKEAIADLQMQVAAIEKQKEAALQEVSERWSQIVQEEREIPVTPAKKDILLDVFGVAWFPYYCVQIGEETVELPGYGQ
jgi:hypothetical protein